MKRCVLGGIRLYQRLFSGSGSMVRPLFPVGGCRYLPTCSEYAYEAVSRYGIIYGLRLGLLRILRCTPWSKGGWDPVK